MTSTGDGEILSRRELRARHPELFEASADAPPAPAIQPEPAASLSEQPTFAPVLTAPEPVIEHVQQPAPMAAAPSESRPFAVELPPAPDWTTVSSPIAPPTIDVSAWQPVGPQQAGTAAVWWIVFLPLLSGLAYTALLIANPAALQVILGVGTGFVTLESLMSTLLWLVGVTFGLALVVLLLSLVLGYRDRKKLQALGHPRTASPWWMLLATLVYLVIRTNHVRRATGRGSAPLVVWVILYMVPSSILTVVQLGALFA